MKSTEFLKAIGGLDALIESAQADEYLGYCVFCGAEAGGVEPDARRYHCDECGMDGVYGAEELIIRFA